MNPEDEHHLCFSHTSSSNLVYKHNDSLESKPLVYKVKSGGWTTVTFAWPSDAYDLDICAFWNGASGMKVGYGWNTSTAEQITKPYHIFYSGDIIAAGASEWCKIKMFPWSGDEAKTFEVHFNFYGYNSETYPGNICSIMATQENGPTKIIKDFTCSTRTARKAETTDPGVLITFDSTGTLISMEVL